MNVWEVRDQFCFYFIPVAGASTNLPYLPITVLSGMHAPKISFPFTHKIRYHQPL